MENYCSNCSKGNSNLNIQYEVSQDSGNSMYGTKNVEEMGNSNFGFDNYAKPEEIEHKEESAFQNYTKMDQKDNDNSNFYMTFNVETEEKKKEEDNSLVSKMQNPEQKKEEKEQKKQNPQEPSIAEIENSDYNPLEDILGRY